MVTGSTSGAIAYGDTVPNDSYRTLHMWLRK